MLNHRIKDIGEKELIKRISQYAPKKQLTDDCAFLEIGKEKLLINTDLMVENTHFNKLILTPKELGWKATVTNFSDLISSGCEKIIGINIGLIINPNTNWGWVEELYMGINESLKIYGGNILGGDCSKGSINSISITAIGTQGEIKLRRYSCKPGEILLTSGAHGLSKVGFLIKNNLISESELDPQLVKDSLIAFCKPTLKDQILKDIIKTRDSKDRKEIGCTDSSDGFYQAILDLATESECKAVIDFDSIPKKKNWPKGKQWDKYYFFGGEDYELIFSLPRNWANKVLEENKNITEIGYLEQGSTKVEIKNYSGNFLLNQKPFSHF